MCVIIDLPAGKSFSYEKLKNATFNNPDGFGLISIDRGKMEVNKFWDDKGNDPDKVAKELEERFDTRRFLHLRYATAGDKDSTNSHPFTVIDNSDLRVEFMHNGTLYKFKEHTAKESDTFLFNQKFLIPLLSRYHGDGGFGDFHDDFVKKLLDEHFNGSNRGLLISNKQDPLFLGNWVTEEGFKVSNNDYFKEALKSRMADYYKKKFEAEEEEERLAKEAARFRNQQQSSPHAQAVTTYEEKKVTLLKEVNLGKVARFLVPSDLEELFGGGPNLDIDDDLLGSIGYLSMFEIAAWVAQNQMQAAKLVDYLACRLHDLGQDYENAVEKKLKGEKKIAELVEELKAQKAFYEGDSVNDNQ